MPRFLFAWDDDVPVPDYAGEEFADDKGRAQICSGHRESNGSIARGLPCTDYGFQSDGRRLPRCSADCRWR